jgi:hypothetical protein
MILSHVFRPSNSCTPEVLFKLTNHSDESINVNFYKYKKYNWGDVYIPKETIWETMA